MPAFGLALAASAAIRAASLNLCTDEYLLLLARPSEIASVSYLAHSQDESILWRSARKFPANSGSVESVLPFRPALLLTMGSGGRDKVGLAKRLGMRVLDLPYPSSIAEVGQQAAQVAAALGSPRRALPFLARLRRLRATAPAQSMDAAFLSGGGMSLAHGSLGASWMALSGFRQRRLNGGRLTLEELATNPPKWLIRSDYRARQFDGGQAWLGHPIVGRLSYRTIPTDGRAWTCGGLPMVAEVERLRASRR